MAPAPAPPADDQGPAPPIGVARSSECADGGVLTAPERLLGDAAHRGGSAPWLRLTVLVDGPPGGVRTTPGAPAGDRPRLMATSPASSEGTWRRILGTMAHAAHVREEGSTRWTTWISSWSAERS